MHSRPLSRALVRSVAFLGVLGACCGSGAPFAFIDKFHGTKSASTGPIQNYAVPASFSAVDPAAKQELEGDGYKQTQHEATSSVYLDASGNSVAVVARGDQCQIQVMPISAVTGH